MNGYPSKPATDGALLLAIINETIEQGLYDREFLLNYSNSPDLVNCDPNTRTIWYVSPLREGSRKILRRTGKQDVVGPEPGKGGKFA